MWKKEETKHSETSKFVHDVAEHTATHAAGHLVGHAIGGGTGAAIGGFFSGLLHVGTLNEGEDRWVSEKIEQEILSQSNPSDSTSGNFHKK